MGWNILVEKPYSRRLKLTLYFLTGLISAATFYIIVKKGYPDVPLHNTVVNDYATGKIPMPGHFLYFLVIYLLSFGKSKIILSGIVSVLVLTAAVLFKLYFTQRIVNAETASAGAVYNNDFSRLLVLLLPFALIFCNNLIYKPSGTMSLGYIPVSTWHNSTTIFLMPFALALFYFSYKYLQEPRGKLLVFITLLLLLNISVKPSYVLVHALVFPVFALVRFRLRKEFFIVIPVMILAALTLYGQMQYIFYSSMGVGGGITVKFLHVWSHWSQNILLSLLVSILFPLVYTLTNLRSLNNPLFVVFAWCNFIVALLIYCFLSETGFREFDGNFAWQAIICNFFLFLATSVDLLITIRRKGYSAASNVSLLLLALHLAAGILFVVKSPVLGYR